MHKSMRPRIHTGEAIPVGINYGTVLFRKHVQYEGERMACTCGRSGVLCVPEANGLSGKPEVIRFITSEFGRTLYYNWSEDGTE